MATVPGSRGGGFREFMVDMAILAGVGLTSYGAWVIYQPAGFITLGVILLTFGVGAAMVRR